MLFSLSMRTSSGERRFGFFDLLSTELDDAEAVLLRLPTASFLVAPTSPVLSADVFESDESIVSALDSRGGLLSESAARVAERPRGRGVRPRVLVALAVFALAFVNAARKDEMVLSHEACSSLRRESVRSILESSVCISLLEDFSVLRNMSTLSPLSLAKVRQCPSSPLYFPIVVSSSSSVSREVSSR